jgi:hypothetical protein
LLRRFAPLRKRFAFVAGNGGLRARLLHEPFAKMIRSAMTKRRSAINFGFGLIHPDCTQ